MILRPPCSTHDQPQLAYPQLLLEASLQSLLAHSFASTMTTLATDTNLEPDTPLSESWATLSDYSREDDLRSETTDVGSLVSNNGTEDIHSVHEDDDSEAEDEPQTSSNDDNSSEPSDPLGQPEDHARMSTSYQMDTPTSMSTHSNLIAFE